MTKTVGAFDAFFDLYSDLYFACRSSSRASSRSRRHRGRLRLSTEFAPSALLGDRRVLPDDRRAPYDDAAAICPQPPFSVLSARPKEASGLGPAALLTTNA